MVSWVYGEVGVEVRGGGYMVSWVLEVTVGAGCVWSWV